jgi:hypothetical protein
MARHCPLCGLYFHYASELDLHAREDHMPVHVAEREEHITSYHHHTGRPELGPYLNLM